MLLPKKTKYRKQMKGRIKGVASRGTEIAFGCADQGPGNTNNVWPWTPTNANRTVGNYELQRTTQRNGGASEGVPGSTGWRRRDAVQSG